MIADDTRDTSGSEQSCNSKPWVEYTAHEDVVALATVELTDTGTLTSTIKDALICCGL